MVPTTASTGGTDVVRLVRTFAAPREKVFDAWTDPALMSEWFARDPSFGPTRVLEVDARPGGRYRVEVQSDRLYVGWGEYLEVDRPRRLAFTWNWEHHDFTDAVVTVELRDVAGGTELTVTHAHLPTDRSRTEHRDGWRGCFEMLERTLAAA